MLTSLLIREKSLGCEAPLLIRENTDGSVSKSDDPSIYWAKTFFLESQVEQGRRPLLTSTWKKVRLRTLDF